MERTIFTIALLALGTIWLASSPGSYNRHNLIKNSEVIAYVNVDDFRCSKSVCHQGDVTIESTASTADVTPVYAIKGHLDSRITFRLPVT
jgi:hypothetical protein